MQMRLWLADLCQLLEVQELLPWLYWQCLLEPDIRLRLSRFQLSNFLVFPSPSYLALGEANIQMSQLVCGPENPLTNLLDHS